MHAGARGVHEHRARPIDDVPRRHLPAARLQHVLHLAMSPTRDLLHHAEDRPDRHVDVDVGGPIERIEEEAVLAAAESVGNGDDVRLFLGRHGTEPAPMVHRLHDGVVGEDVELLLDLPLHIRVLRRAEDVGQAGAAHLVRDHLGGERHVVEDAGQLTRGLRVHAFLLDDEALDRDDRRRGVLNHSPYLSAGR